jgi:hypothetical protein
VVVRNGCVGQTDNFRLDSDDVYGPEFSLTGALPTTGAGAHPLDNFKKQESSMKTQLTILTLLAGLCVHANTTIDSANPYAYGANIGWINGYADGANGMVVGQDFCSGFMYSANCGWINLGDGSPVDGQAYSNIAGDCGVNHDGLGSLTGYAYGAAIGWINFEQTQGQPKVDLMTGEMSGYAWSASCGWINLAEIKTLSIDSGPDTDNDTIPDAWEYRRYGNLTWLSDSTDRDSDGVSDVDEYLADTDPVDVTEKLRITAFETANSANSVTWPAKSTRVYTLEHADVLDGSWNTAVTPFIPSSDQNVTQTVDSSSNRFYRVKASLPLEL